MGKHLEQALPSVYTLQCLTGKVDNNNNNNDKIPDERSSVVRRLALKINSFFFKITVSCVLVNHVYSNNKSDHIWLSNVVVSGPIGKHYYLDWTRTWTLKFISMCTTFSPALIKGKIKGHYPVS